jgi:hypothetical protein
MKVKALKVKNIRRATLKSGFTTKIGLAGGRLVAFAPDSFGGSWFSITQDQLS